MYSNDRLVILDADGTTIDAFSAIEKTFALHRMTLGPLERFQKRRNMFKYLGGLKEFPTNLRRQLGATRRSRLVDTLTEVYREEATLYPGIVPLLDRLAGQPDLRFGIVTRNITRDPVATLQCLFLRQGFDPERFDFLIHLPLSEDKLLTYRALRERFAINPARAFACGDEGKDYLAAIHSGMHPCMVCYGFEDWDRLVQRHDVPAEVISRTPDELSGRLLHALGLGPAV